MARAGPPRAGRREPRRRVPPPGPWTRLRTGDRRAWARLPRPRPSAARPPRAIALSLEREFQPHFDHAAVILHAGDASERGRRLGAVRIGEVRMVEHIEERSAVLEAPGLGEAE